MACFALPSLTIVPADDINVPESLVVSVPHLFLRDCRDLLIRWHGGRCNVVREEVALGADMK